MGPGTVVGAVSSDLMDENTACNRQVLKYENPLHIASTSIDCPYHLSTALTSWRAYSLVVEL